MRLLIRPLMLRPRPASRLHPRSERWILNAFKANNPPRKMTRIPETLKRISLPRIILLMRHQIGPNPYPYSPRKTKTVILVEENPNDKAKAIILLPLASTPPVSRRTRKIYWILSTTLVSKKIIMPTSISKRSQKTSIDLDDLHVGD